MDLNKLTIKTQEVVQRAQQVTLEKDQQIVDTVHLFKALLETDESVTPFILSKFGVNAKRLEQTIESIIKSKGSVIGGALSFSRESNTALQRAFTLANKAGDDYVSVEHLFQALLEGNDNVSRVLKDNGLDKKGLQTVITELRNGEKVTSNSHEATYDALNKYARNLIKEAQEGKLDPVIGRDEEIRRTLQILTRRTKNNPILIGEPGVGKTAIAEGIAHRIVNGDVPDNLKDKTLFSLDMGALVAGAKYKGEFEERLKSVVKEVQKSDGNIVLFIDEIHTLVGAGKGEGAMDAANILKPALARGELRAIGATTLDEYQKYFEKDKALERRFQKVMVNEPDTESAISILRGIKEKYENHHKVQIKDNAIIAAVELSQRYITDRFLPDKAIDLIDEAASKLRMEMNCKPQELDELDRKIMQLEIEREAIKREKDENKIKALGKELSELNASRTELNAKWQAEKDVVDGIQNGKKEIEELKTEAERAERDGNYERVAEIRYGRLKEVEEEIEIRKAELADMQTNSKMIKEEVDVEEIAEVVSQWTGIQLSKMLEGDKEKLLRLEKELGKRLVGQHEAIRAVSDAVRRSRSGMADEDKPIGSFIFLGTTGVGKTELAKALSEFLFNDENAMTRIDMSEYQEKHSVSRLVGAPPGYVGYDEGGQLTEAVRRKPYSVVLLDEIEKAHPDVFNIMLQVLDDGHLTDNKGRKVNFKNTIIIMTSNVGSHIIQHNYVGVDSEDLEVFEKTSEQVINELKNQMRPEFLNRIDEIIMFTPLSKAEITEVVKLQLNSLNKRLKKAEITLRVSNEALNYLSEKGYDPQFGARPVKRVIQNEVMNELSKAILGCTIDKSQPMVLDVFDGKIVFRKELEAEETFQLA